MTPPIGRYVLVQYDLHTLKFWATCGSEIKIIGVIKIIFVFPFTEETEW